MDDLDFRIWESTIRRMFAVGLAIAAEPATAHALARAARNLYDALVAEGFSPTDALAITAANQQRPQAHASK